VRDGRDAHASGLRLNEHADISSWCRYNSYMESAHEYPNATDPAAGDVTMSGRQGVAVEVQDLTVAAGDRVLLEEASARFPAGDVTLIVGPSGAGKSIFLRVLAGLIHESNSGIEASGSIKFDDKVAASAKRRRSVGLVFQNFALLDELSPVDNVRLARAHRQHRASSDVEVPSAKSLLRELGVPQEVRTASLSGGQRQRLALARTLAYDPEVILYDEPTSGLDAATAAEVATLIQSTHDTHPKTSIVVTHDYEALTPIADRLYLLDPDTHSLREVDRDQWLGMRDKIKPVATDEAPPESNEALNRAGTAVRRVGKAVGEFLVTTTNVTLTTLLAPLWLLPCWRAPVWGLRFLAHYFRLVAGPSAWAYIAISGIIIGFVTTHFTFEFLPFATYTKPLLIEDLLMSMGFALYRILVPVFATILIAARCGAAVASDVGGKSYGQQMDALRTMGIRPRFYLLTPILYSFLIGAPLLNLIGYYTARATSLVVFTSNHPELGPDFWNKYFHRLLVVPDQAFFVGTWWLLAKVLLCAVGIALIAYHQGARPKYSTRDVSSGITVTILWATLYVLVVHFVFAFIEF